MGKGDRKAKPTPETRDEAKRLRELWDSRAHPSQAEFAETYGIGNQSAVSQFLRGDVPLSLKAARGFAQGLGCRIEDFSPRLAAEAAAIASMVPSDALIPELADLASQVNALPAKQREVALTIIRQGLALVRETVPTTAESLVRNSELDAAQETPARKRANHR